MNEAADTSSAPDDALAESSSLDKSGSILLAVFQNADKALWSRYERAMSTDKTSGAVDLGLVFPTCANGKIRVSEQEARQTVIEKLKGNPFLYSVETPTLKRYRFKGTTERHRSASTDLTIYAESGNKLFNIEFKAGGRSTNRKDVQDISKDLEKLVSEDVNGVWFHLLPNADRGSVPSLWKTIFRELNQVLIKTAGARVEKTLTFHISILALRSSVTAKIQIPADCVHLGFAEPPKLFENNSAIRDPRGVGVGDWLLHRL